MINLSAFLQLDPAFLKALLILAIAYTARRRNSGGRAATPRGLTFLRTLTQD